MPWLLWALGNTMCCIVFGMLSVGFPRLRDVAKSKPVQILMGLMCVFQIWVNMNGIYEMLSTTVIGETAARVIVYLISAFFIVFYLQKATFRNVATDNLSWTLVYVLIAVLVIWSMLTQGINLVPVGAELPMIKSNAWLCFTLSFGAFFYPTFWELLDYNEANSDGVSKVDMKRAFIRGGLLFGAYLLFVLSGAMTTYTTAVDLLKGILVSLVAVSSLSSFLYGSMVNFGKSIGAAIDCAAVALWQLLVPMGVMGVWTLMQNVRIWMVMGMFAAAIIWHVCDRRKALRSMLGNKVPVVIVDHHGDDNADVYGTITHNRARGTHLLEPMKAIVKRLMNEGKTIQEIGKQLGMKPEEVFRLSDFSRDEFLQMMTKGVTEYSKAEILKNV